MPSRLIDRANGSGSNFYEGLRLTGKPIATIVAGQVVMQDNEVFPEGKGIGQFIRGKAVASLR